MNTLALKLSLNPRNPWAEILIAELAELNFDAFEETENGIIAYGNESQIDKLSVLEHTSLNESNFDFELEYEVIPQQNWNQMWESDFKPVFVGEDLAIIAPFHDKPENIKYIIEVLPKMSFGTGHHQTTWMMSKEMLSNSFSPVSVLDMGTGTGILAILAEKLWNCEVLAIDIEDWSVENTIENSERNNCNKITAKKGDVEDLSGLKFDLILANINKNVLKSHMNQYVNCLNKGASLLLSGFFDSDIDELIPYVEDFGLTFQRKQFKENWAQLTFFK